MFTYIYLYKSTKHVGKYTIHLHGWYEIRPYLKRPKRFNASTLGVTWQQPSEPRTKEALLGHLHILRYMKAGRE